MGTFGFRLDLILDRRATRMADRTGMFSNLAVTIPMFILAGRRVSFVET